MKTIFDKLNEREPLTLEELLVLEEMMMEDEIFFNSLPENAVEEIINLQHYRANEEKLIWTVRLNNAVENEEYEEAAKYRDLIASL